MIKSYKLLILASLSLVVAALACSLGSKSNIPLGEPYQSDEGGFVLSKVDGYLFDDTFGMVSMMAPDATSDAGPMIMVMGGLIEEDATAEDLLAEIREDPGDIEIGRSKKLKVDGVEGLIVDVSGATYGGETVEGKIFVAMPDAKQEFIITGLAPKARWKELEPIFDAVLKSVTFIEAQPIDFSFEDLDYDFEEDWEEPDDVVMEDLPMHSDPDDSMMASGGVIRQWAVFAEASSEYDQDDNAAMQATGEPDVFSCGDDPRAWASTLPNTEEYLVLYYETPVIPTELTIYQSYNPSQVVEIQFEDTTGETWLLWYGEPEEVDYCPDMWTHTIDLDEVFYTDTVVIFVDQSILGLGWVEIDAVELVGIPMGSGVAIVQEEWAPPAEAPMQDMGEYPTNYSGLMAESVYQGWVDIIVGETKESDLDRIMTIPGKKSTDSWKPRESHAQTYLYEMPWEGMTGYISVTTEGWVYKKNVTSNTHPTDFALATVNRANYEALKAIYDRDKVIPYSVMAATLESPGFLREQYLREEDSKIVSTYGWYNAAGDRMVGIFYDGMLTGIMGLNFIEAP